jgi:dolichol-phosphate mannosyltransferase
MTLLPPWGTVRPLLVAQALAAALVVRRLARGRRRHPPLEAPATGGAGLPRISVVVPARDEAARLGPCLEGLRTDPAVAEVVVVDDGSTDGTGELAAALGARVLRAPEPPPGWVGKPWALQQGLEAARGEVVVSLDADTRPRPGLAGAMAAALGEADLVTAGARFACDTAGERLLHPAMLATLVYRFGPGDAAGPPPPPARLLANGQCTALRRAEALAAGGYREAAGHMTDDAALARGLARAGWRVAFRDGSALLEVRMHESAREAWREWGRSLALPDVTSPAWQAADLAVVWLTLALPPLRVLARRAGPLDLALLGLRVALLAGLRGSYARRGPAFWLSPLADPAVAVRLTLSALRPTRTWRGRTYARVPAATRARRARR